MAKVTTNPTPIKTPRATSDAKFPETASFRNTLGKAGNTTLGKTLKGAASFAFGPAVFLTGLVVGVCTKATAEVANAALSQWVRNFKTGKTSLFSNNPFLAWMSSASDSLMQGSWNFATDFYSDTLTTMASEFEEFANSGGFGSTGLVGTNDDARDGEAINKKRKEIAGERLEREREKFFKSLDEFKHQDPIQSSQAMQELEKWINRGNELKKEICEHEGELSKKETEQAMENVSNYFSEFEEALEKNPNLKALLDLLNGATVETFAKLQEELQDGKSPQISIDEFNKRLLKLVEESGLKLPDSLVNHPVASLGLKTEDKKKDPKQNNTGR